MRGLSLGVFGVGFMTFFSLAMFFSGDIFSMWLAMELSAISLVSCFFVYERGNSYFSLFNYVLMSSLSSSLIIAGFLFENCFFLCYVGLTMKFGLFPFMGWVYSVFISSNWVVVWSLSTMLKVSFLAIFFYLGASCVASGLIGVCSCVTLLLVTAYFWIFTFSWEHYWCHVALTSSAVLFLLAVCQIPLESLSSLFLVYFVWCSLSIYVISGLGFNSLPSPGSVFSYFTFLVAYPLSLGVFYKLYASLCVFTCGWGVLLIWSLSSISEQYYLFRFIFSGSVSFNEWGGGSWV